ncbi:unnamed protein product [Microthlaspi erraticum]|uniref:Reverse transcriptase domain-containing protein n=1 Tax=Microthlaspi erraticum TaxID=1685480 RepID=A0A6D2ICC2_9BRAS|nr:unnamed protein product [Microthlaspi erraticum]CAA7056112.1 unnamed protein product [Microthlaspi erraticum]
MRKMGFASQWIGWIMACVRSISFSIIINGSDFGNVQPSRGIRQGDPLSPYLFLLCAETLSQMLSQAEQKRELCGMKLARHCPTVSHLLFADDSLFFCKASYEDCRRIARILQDYEAISGQKVNLQKSSITFGNRIHNHRRNVIQGILGITKLEGGGKYLGLTEQFGRRKPESFQGIVKRVKDNVGGWYNQYLSQGGKEVLIKSVAQAKPVYSMSCFLIPKQICEEINSSLSEFWWGTNEQGRRKISWISWERLSIPKNEGGRREWDNTILDQVLTPADAAVAKTIRLSRSASQDEVFWSYTANGEYTVKSGYWVATHMVDDDDQIEPPLGSLALKKRFGNFKYHQRFNISYGKQWQELYQQQKGFSQFDGGVINLEDNMWKMFQIKDLQNLMEEKRLLPFWTVWLICKSRNEFLFAQRNVHPQEDVDRGTQGVAEWIVANPNVLNQEKEERRPLSSKWEPPQQGWLKCNFDSLFKENDDFMDVGWIIRDERGNYIESG